MNGERRWNSFPAQTVRAIMREDVSEPSEIHYSHFIPPPTAGMFLVSHSSFQYATGNRSASILRPSVHLRHPAAPDLSRELEGSVVCRSLSKEYREKLQQKQHEHTIGHVSVSAVRPRQRQDRPVSSSRCSVLLGWPSVGQLGAAWRRPWLWLLNPAVPAPHQDAMIYICNGCNRNFTGEFNRIQSHCW